MADERFRVVAIDIVYPDVEVERRLLAEIGADLEARQCRTEDEVLELARGADGIVAASAPCTRRVMEGLERCKVIMKYGVGLDNIDLPAATERGIVVGNTPYFCGEEVATNAMTLLLAAARKLIPLHLGTREGSWGEAKRAVQPVHSLEGQVLGLVAFGNIAKRVARMAEGMMLRVMAYDPYLAPEVFEEHGVVQTDFHTLLREADFVSVHTPLTDETCHMFGEAEFRMMKPEAFFINTSRGGVVNERALYQALTEGWIAGAALDVLEEEPINPSNPLLALENVIFTPHSSSLTQEAFSNMHQMIGEDMVAVLTGRWPRYLANPDVREKVSLAGEPLEERRVTY